MVCLKRMIAPIVMLAASAGVSAAAADKSASPVQGPVARDRLEALWMDLESDDSVQAQLALLALAEIPNETVALLSRRLQVGQGDRRRIAQWIDDLDSGQFAVRQKATRELELVLEHAAPHLQKALAGKPSLETSRRIERLLERREESFLRRQSQTVRALALLEYFDTADARRQLETIAAGDEEAWTTEPAQAALIRLKKRPDVSLQRLWEELSGRDPGAAARACLRLAGNPPKSGVAGREELQSIVSVACQLPPIRSAPLSEATVGLPEGQLPPYYRSLLTLYVDDKNEAPVREAVRAAVAVLIGCDKELKIQTQFETPAPNKKADWQGRLMEHQKEVAAHVALLERAAEDLKELEEERQRESKYWQANCCYVRACLCARRAFLVNYSAMLAKLRRDELPLLDPKDHRGWQLTIRQDLIDRDAFALWQEGRQWLQRLTKEQRATPWEFIAKQQRETLLLGLDWAPLAK